MFQDLYSDLPVMSTEVLALRNELWEADGQHLIFNVPYFGEGQTRTGPVQPFRGLCVAFLLLLRKDNQMFAPQLGCRPHWDTNTSTEWAGYKDKDHPGFSAGYYYVYFYFEKSDTLHGYVNNLDLADDTVHPYNVNMATNEVLFGQQYWHEVETCEVHWVAWGSPHNRGALPSQSVRDQLFVQNEYGEYHYEYHNIFNFRSGSVITVSAKYEANTNPIRRVQPDVGFQFASGLLKHLLDEKSTRYSQSRPLNRALHDATESCTDEQVVDALIRKYTPVAEDEDDPIIQNMRVRKPQNSTVILPRPRSG
ncbi:hypothetical protein MTO96_027591 [Rhipicephalus appendiculatus]